MMKLSLLSMLIFVGVSLADDQKLGKLSEKYESSGRGPSTVSTGKDDPGGVSYGTYQLASMTNGKVDPYGSAARFAKKYYPDTLGKQVPGSPQFTAIWKELAEKQTEKLKAQEHEFIFDTHYSIQKKLIEDSIPIQLDKRSMALRDVVWSSAVHHGPYSRIIIRVLEKELMNSKKIENITDAALIEAIYEERGRTLPNGKLANFPGLTSEDWIKALINRFKNEKKDALDMLKVKN